MLAVEYSSNVLLKTVSGLPGPINAIFANNGHGDQRRREMRTTSSYDAKCQLQLRGGEGGEGEGKEG